MGVRRVVFASSIAAYGFIYAPQMWAPDFLPFDESHPCRPQDPLRPVQGRWRTHRRLLRQCVGYDRGESADHRHQFRPNLRGVPRGLAEPPAEGPHPLDLRGRQRRRNGVPAGRRRPASKATRHSISPRPLALAPDDTHELIRRYLPDADNIRQGLTGNWSCMDASKAEERLGFTVQHTWEQYVSPEDG